MRTRAVLASTRELVVLALAALVAVTILYPAAGIFFSIARGLAHPAPAPIPIHFALLWPTIAVCGTVTVLAVLMALPAAWLVRRWPRAFPLLLVPLLLPSYLAYAGWGMIRAPGTWLGDFLLRGPTGGTASANWWPVAASRIQAVLGIAFWAWPIAAVIAAAAFSRIDEHILEELRLDGAPWHRRFGAVLRMGRGGIAAGAAAVLLVVVGSAVPLNVAQVDTYANTIWRLLDELPWDQRWRVWVAAWPLVAMALGAGLFISRRAILGHWDEFLSSAPARRGGATPVAAASALVWSLSVFAPLAITILNLRSARSLLTFWRLSASAIQNSAEISVAAALLCLFILAAVWVGAEGRGWSRALAAACVSVLLAAGLTPGVLVGAAIAQAWNHSATQWLADSPAVVVLGHTARYGFLAAISGWFLARSEARSLRELRRIDAGGGVRGWAAAALRPRLGAALATALACGVLSFHEIESAVMLQPPTSAGGGFAWKMLQALHFNREEDLVPAMVTVMGLGLIGAMAVVVVMVLGSGRPSVGTQAPSTPGLRS